MGEETIHLDRTVEQAILAIKKGAYLLKCGRRGKPKFCPFRLSTDEKYLIWYSGEEERQLRLSSVTKIINGQRTVNFQKKNQQDRKEQSFSLIYANGERSLDLICKDKAQLDSWSLGLRAVISKFHHPRMLNGFRSRIGVQSCANSPVGYSRRKHNLGLFEEANESCQVRSLCGSPSQSLKENCFSDDLSYSSENNFYAASELSLPQSGVLTPTSPYNEPFGLKKCRYNGMESPFSENPSRRIVAPISWSLRTEKNDLKDVMIWGEGILEGNIGGVVDNSVNGVQVDALLPILLESTAMLDVRSISLGGKHAALVTKQGEVFCWGDGNGGKLGHKVNMDVSYPKLVESLNGVRVQSVTTGEYETCAVTESGELYTWGGHSYGGEIKDRVHWLPHRLSGPLDGVKVSSVACGEWHTAILSTSGKLYTYGDGTFGVLGHGNTYSYNQPTEVESLGNFHVKAVSCGPWHTAAIVETTVERYKYNVVVGKLYTWGDGDKKRLGHDDGERKLLPTFVKRLDDYDFVQVSCGATLTVGLTSSGTVYTMGSSANGQLGNPRAKDKSITLVEGELNGEFVKEISSGSYHIAVLTVRGSVFTWGKGTNGQLGLGDVKDRNSPTFVDALGDRLVENIVSRSNSTAAICLHKSISLSAQSSCSGCKLTFGFTRKKHNCQNCGLLFCNPCSNRKVINASLARNKSKASRVCEHCFNHVRKISQSGRLYKVDDHSTPRKISSDDKETRGKSIHTNRIRNSITVEGHQLDENKNHGVKQQDLGFTSSPIQVPRWGHVSHPGLGYLRGMGFQSSALVKFETPSSQYDDSSDFEFVNSSSLNIDKNLSELNNKLTEEVDSLRAEARNLEMRCELGNKKIRECQRKIDETWLLAKEEAAKYKAAKEVMKALELKVHKMKEQLYGGMETKTKMKTSTDASLSQVMPVQNVVAWLPSKLKLPKQRLQGDSVGNSPIVFSNTLKSMYGKDAAHQEIIRSLDTPRLVGTEPHQQNGNKASALEWVEEYDRGVYVTLTILPSGQKGLKRVRFSRKQFTEKEAARWWEVNQVVVYENYGIEGYSNSNDNQTRS